MEKVKKVKCISLEKALRLFLLVIVMLTLMNTFIFQSFWIPSGSMKPTLKIGDIIIASKCSYWNRNPVRGEIIVFRYPKDISKFFVKRIIGLPGEKVEIKNSRVYINGIMISEAYVIPKEYCDFSMVTVPDNQYFVLGDSRADSEDSRVWGFLDEKYIVGKVSYRYWPLDSRGRIF